MVGELSEKKGKIKHLSSPLSSWHLLRMIDRSVKSEKRSRVYR